MFRHEWLAGELPVGAGAISQPYGGTARSSREDNARRNSGWADHADALDSAALIDHLTVSGLRADVEQVLAGATMPLPACTSPAAMPAEAEAGWWHIFGFLNLDHLRKEVKLAESEAAANLTQDTQRRALSLKAALHKVIAGEPDGVELAA